MKLTGPSAAMKENLNNCLKVPRPGEYVFELWCRGQCSAERRLSVHSKGDEP